VSPGQQNAKPLVSVVIPAYNRAGIIGETIENVFEQTYSNIELIVVDDGSTDDTVQILKSYGDRIRWAVQQNAGPAAARNRGIAMAKGEIVAFQDSDDAWDPSKIERQVSLMQRAGTSIVCCLCNSIVQLPGVTVRSFENAPVNPSIAEGIWLNPAEILATRFILFNQAAAIRREVLLRIGGFDESLRLMEDMDLGLRLSLEGPWTFIREPLATRQDKLARTLGHEATPQIVGESGARILERILRAAEGNTRLTALRPIVCRELRRTRRQLRAIRMKSGKSLGAPLLGWALEMFEHYRLAVYRRTPWFPEMKVLPVSILG
jgi:glycosyltransferase involved in cell wall biosynthesis